VNQAVLPPGFMVHGRREAYRLRTGLALLIISVLLATLATILYTAFFRYFLQLPPGVARPWTAWHAWDYSLRASYLLELLAIWLIAWPCWGPAGHSRGRLRLATIIVAAIAFLVHLADWTTLLPQRGSGVLGSPPPLLLATVLILSLCRPISLILLWLCLLARVDRSASPGLWAATCALVAAPSLALPGHIMRVVYEVCAAFNGWPWNVLPYWDPLLTWASWWHKHVDPACWIVMLLVVWMLLRKLDSALRLKPVAAPTSAPAPPPP
jgi:hypothetical protein